MSESTSFLSDDARCQCSAIMSYVAMQNPCAESQLALCLTAGQPPTSDILATTTRPSFLPKCQEACLWKTLPVETWQPTNNRLMGHKCKKAFCQILVHMWSSSIPQYVISSKVFLFLHTCKFNRCYPTAVLRASSCWLIRSSAHQLLDG